MKMATAVAVAGVVIGVGRAETAAQSRFDVGLLLGSTRTTDEGTVLQFDRGTTYQATFAWPVWRTDAAELSVEVPFIASPAFTVVGNFSLATLVSRNSDSSHNSRAGHPGWLRCSLLTYFRYARSSRLAIRAPRSGTYATNHCYGTLGPRVHNVILSGGLVVRF